MNTRTEHMPFLSEGFILAVLSAFVCAPLSEPEVPPLDPGLVKRLFGMEAAPFQTRCQLYRKLSTPVGQP